ncbi:hypothetical protein I3760_12G127400, partial [Carya illinoinensis]
LKFLDCSLRVCAIPLSAATIWLTVTNRQDNSTYGKLEFSNIVGLQYMVCISAICACYSFIAAISLSVGGLVAKAWLFFVSDQIVAYLIVTSGDTACSSYGRFCCRMKLALVLYVLALWCFIVLAVISAYRTFIMFEPPSLPSKEVKEEIA